MLNLKSTVFTLTLFSTMIACSPEEDVIRPDSGTEPAVESAADMAREAREAANTTAQTEPAETPSRQAQSFSQFVAVLQPTEGNEVSGTVRFTDTEVGVSVDANVTGLTPMSAHGFHIHEVGDCSAPDASSAGDHFNPLGQPHGAPDSQQRHVGDLGNLLSNGEGVAQTTVIDMQLSFSGENSILGRSVVIHAGADDLQTQPSGDAGARLACGVIEIDNQ